MTLTQKMFQALFNDNSIEKAKDVAQSGNEFKLTFRFEKDDTSMFFDVWLSGKQIIDIAEKEFGKDETGLVFDNEGYLDMSKNEILQYLDDNAERIATQVREWEIEPQID